MESRISSREEVEDILRDLGECLEQPVQVLVIGGAAMMEYGPKDATKDIDMVCKDAAGKDMLLKAATSLGFEVVGPEKRHVRLGIEAQYSKAGSTEQKIWVTYIEEAMGRLEEDYRLQVPIADRISELADGYREVLLRKMRG